jgi:two-component system nitrate/nitrite response regulator NarL
MAKIYILYGAMAQSKRKTVTQRGSDLTDRQREIATLVCAGHPSKIIARKLRISEGTVKTHLHAIYSRLGVENRASLVEALGPEQSGKPQI